MHRNLAQLFYWISYSACRICGSEVSVTHFVTLFSRESFAANTPEQLHVSRVVAVPVIQDDSLSRVICCPCKRKFQIHVVESFQDTAKSTHEKSGECKTEHTLLPHRTSY